MKKNIYFIGIGGIGMSAIARFYLHEGHKVAGYDRVETVLTKALKEEGAKIHYCDDIELIGDEFKNAENTLVIYTPAIPSDHTELNYFLNNNFNIIKRSKALGELSKDKFLIAVAGTHGKTSISTMISWFSHNAAVENGKRCGGSAFLGGISKNIGSNLLLGEGERLTVEADEFDRSFLQLFPHIATISSTDADHLDIYGTHDQMKKTFSEFVSQIKKGGALIYKKGVELEIKNSDIKCYNYSLFDKSCSSYSRNITLGSDGLYSYDIVTPFGTIEGCKLGIPGLINVENSIVAATATLMAGCDPQLLKEAIESFKGVKRRFELYINREDKVYIDDYAHHPTELSSTLKSIKEIYAGKKITAIFQPHLYSRTKDFAKGFSEALSAADKVILLPIYPARELPIEGVVSEMLLEDITSPVKFLAQKEELLERIKEDENEVIVTFGAGDIDLFCPQIAELLK